ncbi:hypothetical protein [Streptomyces bauhiniae]|uniref:hypothetical protein n=1 Tax=Streptomyces bauhiniae TaxID=2340725 RepID=UPI0035DDE4A1
MRRETTLGGGCSAEGESEDEIKAALLAAWWVIGTKGTDSGGAEMFGTGWFSEGRCETDREELGSRE